MSLFSEFCRGGRDCCVSFSDWSGGECPQIWILIHKTYVKASKGSPKGYDSGGLIRSKERMELRIGLLNEENCKLRIRVKELENSVIGLEKCVKDLKAENVVLLQSKKRFENAKKYYRAFRRSFDVEGN